MDDLTKQGIEAFQAGKRDEARKLLLTAVKQNPDNENAWGWLYNIAENDKERIYCLKQVLRINPKNEKVNQLYKSLLDKQSNFKSSQSQISKQVSEQVPIASQPIQKQPIQKNKSTNTKGNRSSLIVFGIFASIALCICGVFAFSILLNSSDKVTAKTLSAAETFEVSAVDIVKNKRYTITSAVCEVISPKPYAPFASINEERIVFHAFRINNSALNSEVIVLFASNHTATDGIGLTYTINPEAIKLFPDFPDGPSFASPITDDYPGAQTALDCARQAAKPPSLNFGNNFDTEEWRRKAIEKFGAEEVLSDGSKEDYVRLALAICKQSSAEQETMKMNLGADYEGSFQQFVIETFCPYAGDN